MAGIPLRLLAGRNNNGACTDLFRTYVKDNFLMIRDSCSIVTPSGNSTGQFKNKSHALWMYLGLDARYCMIADYLNCIDGDTDLTLLSKLYLPDTPYLEALARKINR